MLNQIVSLTGLYFIAFCSSISLYYNASVFTDTYLSSIFQNSEFHRTIEELTRWLEATTQTIRTSEPVDLSVDHAILEAKHDKFLQLHADLLRCEPRIVSLQEAADQLEPEEEEDNAEVEGQAGAADRDSRATSPQCQTVKRKLSLLSQKLRILINVCHVYAVRLARALGRRSGIAAMMPGVALDGAESDNVILPTLSDEVLDFSCL